MNEREVVVRDSNGSVATFGIIAVIAYRLLIVAALLLPETKGRVLTADA